MDDRLTPALAGLAMVVASVCHTTAGTIAIPNASFESPAVAFVGIPIDSWQKSPKPDWYDESPPSYQWDQLTGLFKNPAVGSTDHIDNCDGDQAIWLFAVPEVALFQDYESGDGTNTVPLHLFDARFEVGNSYALTVGVMGGSGFGMSDGATLEISLYYRDDATNRVMIASTSITNSAESFPTHTHLVDYAVQTPVVQAGDPWAGRHIGIQLLSTVSTNLQGGYWDLDDVRLVAIPPPSFSLSYDSTGGGLRISWPSATGYQYQLRISENLSSWSDEGTPLSGTGSELSHVVQTSDHSNALFTVLATPTP